MIPGVAELTDAVGTGVPTTPEDVVVPLPNQLAIPRSDAAGVARPPVIVDCASVEEAAVATAEASGAVMSNEVRASVTTEPSTGNADRSSPTRTPHVTGAELKTLDRAALGATVTGMASLVTMPRSFNTPPMLPTATSLPSSAMVAKRVSKNVPSKAPPTSAVPATPTISEGAASAR